MKLRIAIPKDTIEVFNIVQKTIKTIYPNFYNDNIVDFFSNLHSKENISRDIENRRVFVLVCENQIVGTGTYWKNHITRVFVLPNYQGKGFGSKIMEYLEDKIKLNYDEAILDTSLPATAFYINRGHGKIKEEKIGIGDGLFLEYDIFKKNFRN